MYYTLFWCLLAGSIFVTFRLFFTPSLAPQYYYFCILMFGSSLFLLGDDRGYRLHSLSKGTVAACCVGVLIVGIRGGITLSGWVTLAAVLLWAFFCVQLSRRGITKLLQAVYSIGLMVAAYGLLQVPDWIPNHTTFAITLPFDNPAGFAGTLAVIFPIGIYWLLYTKRATHATIMIVIGQLLMLVAVCFSGSRAALLSLCISTGLLVLFRLKDQPWLKSVSHRNIMIGGLCLVAIAVLTVSLYAINEDSANGRLLIWQISAEMIGDHPWWGHGRGSFTAEYMGYQADFFRRYPMHTFRLLAGNVTSPFNTFLLIAVEYGIVGLSLVLLGGILLIKHIWSSEKRVRLLSLSVMGGFVVMALLSYPLTYVPLWLLFIFFALLSIKTHNYTINNSLWALAGKGTIAILIIGCLLYTARSLDALITWNSLAQKAQSETPHSRLPEYQDLYPRLRHNPLFLYNYGALLNASQKYRKSTKILTECKKYFNDYDIQLLLAENYKNAHKVSKAIAGYKRAADMIPNRFWPLYQLIGLYQEQNKNKKALQLAQRIAAKKVKVPSRTVTSIKSKMEHLLQSHADSVASPK